MKTFLRNQIILPNRLHTADTRRCLENLEILKKKTKLFFRDKNHPHSWSALFFLLSLFASQCSEHDYRFQRKNYFWEAGNIHINTLLKAWSWELQDSAKLASPLDSWMQPKNKVLLGSILERMAQQAAASCPHVIFLNSHSAWQASRRAPPASEPNSGAPKPLLPWNGHVCVTSHLRIWYSFQLDLSHHSILISNQKIFWLI